MWAIVWGEVPTFPCFWRLGRAAEHGKTGSSTRSPNLTASWVFPMRTLVSFIGLQIKTFGESHPFTKLVVDLKDVDPDVAYSSIPYEKGFALLFYLEQLLGGPGK